MNAVWTAEQQTLASDAECWETPDWAARAILRHEILTPLVVDPCCGPGVMSHVAQDHGYKTKSFDLYDWGFGESDIDFRSCPERIQKLVRDNTVFMNPPFSLACVFVERALELGARKIVCFQRWSWWESAGRLSWWKKYTPQRVYLCADRATCWLVTTPADARVNKEGRPKSTPTAHGWFVWEHGQPAGPLIGHISKHAPG